MTAAHPLMRPDDAPDVVLCEDLSHLPADVRAAIEQAEREVAAGQVLRAADIQETLGEMRHRDG
jgi:hypothetical protein